MRIAGNASDLALQFAIACGIHGSERRAGGSQGLWVGNAARCTENAQELAALAADATEQAEFLKDHRPGNNGKKKKKTQDASSYPAGLGEKVLQVNENKSCKQKNDVDPSVQPKFFRLQQRSTRMQGGQTNEMRKLKRGLPFWKHRKERREKEKNALLLSSGGSLGEWCPFYAVSITSE